MAESGIITLIAANTNSTIGQPCIIQSNGRVFVGDNTGLHESRAITSSVTSLADINRNVLAMSGLYILLAAPLKKLSSGLVDVYRNQNGTLSIDQTLVASDQGFGHQFGSSVSIYNTRIAVGAKFANNNKGAIYVFDLLDTWTQTAIITTIDGKCGDEFGYANDLVGDLMVVGAPLADTVYVYKNVGSSWVIQTKLNDISDGINFGYSVAICDATIAVSARTSGTVTLFDNCEPWNVKQTMYDHGIDTVVSVYRDKLAVQSDSTCPSIYKSDNSYWTIEQNLDDICNNICVSSNIVVCTNHINDVAYVYEFNGSRWVKTYQLTPSTLAHVRFGTAVVINHTNIICSAPLDDTDDIDFGRFYYFDTRNKSAIIGINEQKTIANMQTSIKFRGNFRYESSKLLIPGQFVIVNPLFGIDYKYKGDITTRDTVIGKVIDTDTIDVRV